MIPRQSFTFVRHGETDWNVEARFQGHTDIPLNANGRAQAQNICNILLAEHVDVLVTSPLLRAYETALAIAETHILPLQRDDRLKERSFGSWEGRLRSEIVAELGIDHHDSVTPFLPPNAEQWDATCARMLAVTAEWLTTHPGRSVVFVSHGANFRALVETLTGERKEAQNALPYHFTPTPDGGWSVTEATQAQAA